MHSDPTKSNPAQRVRRADRVGFSHQGIAIGFFKRPQNDLSYLRSENRLRLLWEPEELARSGADIWNSNIGKSTSPTNSLAGGNLHLGRA
mmetsp:Transcript_31869/g.51267  ORF Transcript_31869/g.51267 Transcript_31869/m.51267 type:complete len:90 (+) Transcript_31869:2146-2415(+)